MSAVGGAQQEAADRLERRYDVRVLEPSPPSVGDAPYAADDPTAGGYVVPLERPGTLSWDTLCRQGDDSGVDPGLGPWCAERWLGSWSRLAPLPASFEVTRSGLHRLAEHVVVPARYAVAGKIGLRFTRSGFGTPFFGNDRQVRVEKAELVTEDPVTGVQRRAFTTLREAAAFVGVDAGAPLDVYTPSTSGDLDTPLDVDRAAAEALGAWYGFCCSVLEQLRAEAGDAGRTQLWPEHFDLAVELGDEPRSTRANFGGSPGDSTHPQPYLYVGPWVAQHGEFWNEPFGASLGYGELLAADDQRQTALDFLRRGRDSLVPAT